MSQNKVLKSKTITELETAKIVRDQLVSIPSHPNLSDAEVEKISKEIKTLFHEYLFSMQQKMERI